MIMNLKNKLVNYVNIVSRFLMYAKKIDSFEMYEFVHIISIFIIFK